MTPIIQKELYSSIDDIGHVIKVSDDIVYATGMLKVQMSEVVVFTINPDKVLLGIVNFLDAEGLVGIIVMGDSSYIKAKMRVRRSSGQAWIYCDAHILSKVIDPLGNVLYGKTLEKTYNSHYAYDRVKLEQEAPSIIKRQPVREPLETGIKFIDSMIPIGCGQRELIIGDKKTGKTTIAIDTIINQKGYDIICIYVAIGQKKASIAKVAKLLDDKGCSPYVVIVAASASDPAALQYLAPYSGCAIGEYFRDNGWRVLVIYDDLSKHAVAYRQMALLLRRPPGREGYPGDVFYIHSKLLERAAKLKNTVTKDNIIVEGGSLTALPIIETIQGDVSAYIPTNVISITDGQIFLEADLFNRGIIPAISPGISVSRVGSAAQNKIIKELASSLKLELAQYREIEEFVKLGLVLDEATMLVLEKGRRLVQLLKQPQNKPVNMIAEIILLYSGLKGLIIDLEEEQIPLFERKLITLSLRYKVVCVLAEIIRIYINEFFIYFIVNLLKLFIDKPKII